MNPLKPAREVAIHPAATKQAQLAVNCTAQIRETARAFGGGIERRSSCERKD